MRTGSTEPYRFRIWLVTRRFGEFDTRVFYKVAGPISRVSSTRVAFSLPRVTVIRELARIMNWAITLKRPPPAVLLQQTLDPR